MKKYLFSFNNLIKLVIQRVKETLFLLTIKRVATDKFAFRVLDNNISQ